MPCGFRFSVRVVSLFLRGLGPLHYLTEISWLHDRNYFVEGVRDRRLKRAWLALVLITLAVMLYGMYSEKVMHQNLPPVLEIALFYLVFVTALLLVLVKRAGYAIALTALTLIALIFASDTKFYALTAFFLITIIHVLVFTAAFIFYGVLRGYHYINWFSKTSIIKWHEIPKNRGITIIGLWMILLGIYAHSYQTGMATLYFLSALHVMLEFPLNRQTFGAIGKEPGALTFSEHT